MKVCIALAANYIGANHHANRAG